MAIIGRIRNRMGILVVVFVGFALVAFILTDLLTSNRSFFSSDVNAIGVIAGEEITPLDWEKEIRKQEENLLLRNGKTDLTSEEQDQAREMAWQQITNNRIYGKQFDKLGISVPDDELFDMVSGRFVHQEVKRAFSDPNTGQFNPQQVVTYLKQLDQQVNANNPEALKAKAQWLNFEEAMQEERIREKYNDLIGGGMYVTTAEAKADFENKNNQYTLKYVVLNYNTISDSSITVTDDDLKKNYNANLWKYKQQDNTRSVNIVTFDVNATAEDRKAASDYINKLVEPFKTATDDTTFINLNSDVRYSDAWSKRGELPPSVDSVAFSMNPGEVYGPYEDFNAFKLSKLLQKRFYPDSVSVRHILLGYRDPQNHTQAEKDSLKTKGDSLVKLLQMGMDFAMLAQMNSTDPGSKDKGGDYGWQTPEVGFVPEFKEAMFNGKIREFQLVETMYGYHIIQTTEAAKTGSTRVRFGTIVRNIEPSSKTFEMIYARANEFSGKNNTLELLEKASKEQNLRMMPADNIRETDKFLSGVGNNAREVVRWIYSAKKGDVSKAFRIENKYAVVAVKDIFEKGYKPLESVKEQVTTEARRDKKAEQLMEKMNAQLKGASNIDGVASKLQTPAVEATNVSFANPYITNLGIEPALAGAISVLKNGQMTKAIKGNAGVIVAQVMNVAATTPPADFNQSKKDMSNQLKQNSQYMIFNALREKANVVDNRGKFF